MPHIILLCCFQTLPNDVILCSVYTYIALICKDVRFIFVLERETLTESQLRDNATLINTIRNLTRQPVHGLETQLNLAKSTLESTPPRGRMCVRTVCRTVGDLDPVLPTTERQPKYRNDRMRYRRQLKRLQKMLRRMRCVRKLIRWQLRVRGVNASE